MNKNLFQLIGNVTKSPIIRATSTTKHSVNFTVAYNESWTDKDGHEQTRTSFIPLTMLTDKPSYYEEEVSAGRRVFVEGKIMSWSKPAENKSGFNFEITNLEFIGPKKAGEKTGASPEKPAGIQVNQSNDWLADYNSH